MCYADRMRALVGLCLLTLAAGARADWTVINLTPTGAWDAAVYAVSPTAQYGAARLGVAPDTPQALMWHGASTAWTLVGGGPGTGSYIYAANSAAQAGYFNGHASLWRGTPESRVDLNPSGSAISEARAVGGDRQFGLIYPGSTDNPSRAAMWSGTAASYVDMAPPGSSWSGIYAAQGNQQGGYASFSGFHSPAWAGIWTGTAASFVSLHPGTQYTDSWVAGMAEGEQVGMVAVAPSNNHHAALWHGTAASFTDLNPLGYNNSELLATIGGIEVGFVSTGSVTRAGLWFGTASSFLNLGQFLPPGYYDSRATSIASDGSHYFVGGYATSPITGYSEAFLWVGTVPSPSALSLLAGAGGVLAIRRRR